MVFPIVITKRLLLQQLTQPSDCSYEFQKSHEKSAPVCIITKNRGMATAERFQWSIAMGNSIGITEKTYKKLRKIVLMCTSMKSRKYIVLSRNVPETEVQRDKSQSLRPRQKNKNKPPKKPHWLLTYSKPATIYWRNEFFF